MHGFDDSISLTLAPLSVIYLKYAPVKKRKVKTIKSKTKKSSEIKTESSK